ncbi:DUF58 domain-containing protein [Sediminicurvatus halobius]|uniref:Uncharacterized protein n=1 Tax=Sediminicurvatus halobius TaxID=2182432 RepID=A0A2U2N5M0_9GAMM|nr:DUF58 domain-containing protein [Spiribacter halobius]PWG64259.1 hypothetical protein DEM34_05065 [Spiribacter halobius]UEX79404.1 DUF58 domain-containing protein [Spiribacter halobius]
MRWPAWFAERFEQRGTRLRLRYRRLYILPTRHGLLFAAMVVVMWLGAVNYSNSLAFLLAFLMAGLFVAAMHHAFANLLGLEVAFSPGAPVFAGEMAVFPVHLDNPARRTRLAVEAEGESVEASPVDVATRGEAALELRCPARRRGRLSPGRLALASRYPTGLFRVWTWLRPAVSCLVYPRPEAGEVPPPPGRAGASRGRAGGSGDDDFAGLRRYRPGDPLRRVAWKAAARSQELPVKVFQGEAPARLLLRWADTELSDTEARLSRLCRWVLDADAEGRVYELELPGLRLGPSSGAAHRARCLAALAEFPGHA